MNKTDLYLRPYQSEDLEAILALFYETVHTINAKDYTPRQLDAWADGHPDKEAWDRSLHHHISYVALYSKTIVGFGDMDVQKGYLDRLYVHKDYQGLGIATALLARLGCFVENRAIEVAASQTALPFFLKQGFEIVTKQTVYRHGVALTNYRMLKKP